MTQFEASDQGATTVPIDGSALGKFQADYQNTLQGGDFKIVKVSDMQQAGQPTDATAQAAPAGQDSQGGGDQKIDVKAIVGADPTKLSASEKVMQGLASHFDKSDDKAKALGEVKAEVEKTISAADQAQTTAENDVNTQMAALEPKVKAVSADIEAAKGPFQDAAKKVPATDQKHVAAELSLLADDKTSPGVRKAIEADLAQYQGLVPAVEKLIVAEKAAEPVLQQVQALQDKMQAAGEDPIVARMVYADMLEQGGDKAGAKQVQAEAMGLQMGLTIDQVHKLQQQQKQQQPKN